MRIYPPFTIVLVVLFLSVKCYSTQKKEQQINIDSLKIETELTRAYERRYQPDSFFQISQNAFQLSLELENAHLKFKSKLLIALSYLYQNKLEESEKAFDKLAIELKEIKNEQIVIDYYLYYAWFISFKGMVDESIKISHENIKRSEKNGNYKLNLIYDFLSSVEFNAGYYETSLQNKLKARDYTAPSDKKTLMGIDSKIGMLYLDIGITYNAIHYYQSSLKFSEEINVAYIDAYYGLGMCYFSEKEFEKAYSNFKKAVSIAKSKNISTNYYVPINSYLHYWKCSTLLNKPYHKELGDDFILKTKHLLQNERNPSTEILQAEIYIYYNQPDKAEKIMMQNLSSIENLDASSLTADYYYWLAQATEKQKKIQNIT
ncbi:tetratricopeptide repeat protein [uncultured Draconibacterium sp.]|uniref:tetratricopeptide repeat protein n=1 Tax=uncultured Draconibacterium sp. TaxID=1573823 RepID=UPI0032166B70